MLYSRPNPPSLDLLPARPEIREHGIDAVLVDDAQPPAGNAQPHPALFALDPELAVVEIRLEAPPRPVLCVGDVVPPNAAFSGDLTDFGHVQRGLELRPTKKRARL